MHFARDSSKNVDEAALNVNNPLEENRAVVPLVLVVLSSDPWLLDPDVAAINHSYDILKATCAFEAGGRYTLLISACRPRDKGRAKGGHDGQHSEYAAVR